MTGFICLYGTYYTNNGLVTIDVEAYITLRLKI